MFLVFVEKLYCQSTSTQGRDFWLSVGRNWDNSANAINMQLRIITGTNAASVTLTYTNSGTVQTVNVAAGEVYTHPFTNTEKNRIFSQSTGESNNSLHIESDVAISVYVLNQYLHTADATNVLPVDGLGTDYYHISYLSYGSYRDGYTVIATEDGTRIYENGTLVSTRNKGQVYSAYFVSSDITGQHITSNYPVAYFVTNGGVRIPNNTRNGSDCLYQQLVPVNKWGRNFLVPVTHRGVERIRIVASQDGTVIKQSGGIIRTDNNGYGQSSLNLNRREFVELETNLNSCGCYIESNNPVGVCSYLVGMEYHPPEEKGDPAMAWVPPIEQSINGALIAPFVPYGNSVLDEHYALIITPTTTKNQTTIAIGTTPATGLTGGTWCDNSASGYSFYSLQLTDENASYYFANSYGLTVMVYGIGDYESYYYLSGAASRNLDAAFYINNIHFQDLDNDILCDTIANFRASVQYAQSSVPGYLRWYVDGVLDNYYTDTLKWNKKLSVGNHTVVLKVLNMDNDTIALSSTFDVGIAYYDTISGEICFGKRYYNDYYKFDTIPTAAGFLQCSNKHISVSGCDSIITLNLTVHPSYNDTTYIKSCRGESYVDKNFNIATSLCDRDTTIVQTKTFETLYTCDSIITLHFTAHAVYDYTIDTAICLGDRYNYYGFDTVPIRAGIITVTHRDTTIYGCDSIVRLNLTVHPSYHDTIRVKKCLGEGYYENDFDETPTTTGVFYVPKNLKTTAFGCDSIVTLQLTINPIYNIVIDTAICFGERYSAYGFDTLPKAPCFIQHTRNIPTANGCDSIVTLNITVNPVYYDTITYTMCIGERYNQRGFNVSPDIAGFEVHKQDLRTKNKCDSIIVLHLTVLQSYYDTIYATICQNEIYDRYGFEIIPTNSGFYTYIHDERTFDDCDSVTVLHLKINPVYDEYVSAQIYEDEFYQIGDYKHNTPGIHITNLQTVENCDSIINLNLSVIYYPPAITAFSPFNKDGINDYFMAGFKIQVFNRYGVLVYETITQQERELGWDGRNYNKQAVEPGMYFYILYNSSGKPRIKSSVEVLKLK